jgi:glutaminyl-peptide cyclotransferase
VLKPFRLFLILVLLSACAEAAVPVYDVKVIRTFPHDTNAFTQGLLIHDGYLYEGTGRLGQSSLSRINLEDGTVLQRKQLGRNYFGEGIAIVDQRIYQLTWQSNIVFVHDLETFADIETHYHPTEGWGLTYDGVHLILSDGSDTLQFIDPVSFQVKHRLPVRIDGRPVRYLNELEYIHGEIWANVWMTNEIVRIHPETGLVQAIVDLSPLKGLTHTGGTDDVLNGIAWDADNERIIVTGKLWAHLFEIELILRDGNL